jgi:hypothetical protein
MSQSLLTKHPRTALALILLAGAALRLHGSEFAPDDAACLVVADQVIYGLRPYADVKMMRPPVALAAWLAVAVLPRGPASAQLLIIALGMAIQVLLWALARKWWGEAAGLAAAAGAAALQCYPIAHSLTVTLPTAFICLGLWALAGGPGRTNWQSSARLLLGGAALAFAVGASTAVSATALALLASVGSRQGRRRPALALSGFLAVIATVILIGLATGGASFLQCMTRRPAFYWGAVGPRYAIEAMLRSLETVLAQPSALLALGIAGSVALAINPATRTTHSHAWLLALWIGGLVDVHWGQRYEAGAWMAILPPAALGIAALVGIIAPPRVSSHARAQSGQLDYLPRALLIALCTVAFIFFLPRVKVALGRWRDWAGARPSISADAEAARIILAQGGPGQTMFVWAESVAAAAWCRARLVPPDPWLVHRLAGVWRTAEKTERRQPQDWNLWSQTLARYPPQWIVVEEETPFADLFSWRTYPLLKYTIDRGYSEYWRNRTRVVFKRR